MRLIDADRALEIVRDQGIAHPNAYHLTNYATLILQEAPTIEAKPVVHGEWREIEVELEPEHGVVRKGTKEKFIKCCECGWRVAGEKRKKTNYCPNCGADMRGET